MKNVTLRERCAAAWGRAPITVTPVKLDWRRARGTERWQAESPLGRITVAARRTARSGLVWVATLPDGVKVGEGLDLVECQREAAERIAWLSCTAGRSRRRSSVGGAA